MLKISYIELLISELMFSCFYNSFQQKKSPLQNCSECSVFDEGSESADEEMLVMPTSNRWKDYREKKPKSHVK